MDGAVDEHRGGLDAVAARQLVAPGIDQDDVLAPHLAPVQAARVEQEAAGAIGQLDAEVVAHALSQAMVGRGAQGQRQIVAQLRDGR